MPETLEIPVENAAVDHVSGLLDAPEDDREASVVLFAHGAGAPLDSAFMTQVAGEVARRGLPTLRFNYAYSERMQREGRRIAPERRPRLEAVHASALAYLRERFPGRPVVLAGKSMGGRIASYLAARGEECAGLAFFGYPLHPPGKPERLRSDHFPALSVPTLFLQGTRDALCRPELLEPALETLAGPATLHWIEGGDHDFKVPKSAGLGRDEILAELAGALDEWERTLPS